MRLVWGVLGWFRVIWGVSMDRFTDQGLFKDGLIAITDRCTMHQLRTNYGLFTDHGLLTDQLAVKFTIYCNYDGLFTTTEFLLVHNSVNGPCVVTGQRAVIDLIEMGLTTRQLLWVILCRLPEKGRRAIHVGDSRGDEREGQGRKENE